MRYIVVFFGQGNTALVLDPTVRFENNYEDQEIRVNNRDKKAIYEINK